MQDLWKMSQLVERTLQFSLNRLFTKQPNGRPRSKSTNIDRIYVHSPLNLSFSQQENTQTLGAARFKPSARFVQVKTKRYMAYHRNVIYNPSNIQLQKTRSQAN